MAPSRPALTPVEEFRNLVREKRAPTGPVCRFADGAGEVEDRELRNVIMSTETADRASDSVRADGWRTDDFTENPVLMWGHDYSEPPVGQVMGTEVSMRRLMAKRIVFVPREISPFAGMVADMYLHPTRFLRGFSVGFQPEEFTWDEERGGVNFIRHSLLELSACSIPMNQECLSGAKSAGIDMRPMRERAEQALDVPGSVSWLPGSHAFRYFKALSPTVHQVPATVAHSDAPAVVLRRALESAARMHHLSSLLSPTSPAGAKES